MIRYYNESEIKQGTPEWLELRAGKITGTDAIQIIRGKTYEEILKAKNSGGSFNGNYWTQRGHILEEEGKQIYSNIYEKVQNYGFITNSKYPLAGYSPDGIVGEKGLLEHKAFKLEKHLNTYNNLTPEIIAQTQYGLFITEREWCDLVLYNPDAPIEKAFLVRRLYVIPEIQEKFKKFFKNLDIEKKIIYN